METAYASTVDDVSSAFFVAAPTWLVSFNTAENKRVNHFHFFQVLAHFNVNFNQGLSDARVADDQLRYGKNELAPDPGEFWLQPKLKSPLTAFVLQQLLLNTYSLTPYSLLHYSKQAHPFGSSF